jgi:hypothetical protein
MKTAIYSWRNKTLSTHALSNALEDNKVNLVLCFGSKSIYLSENVYGWLKEKFPAADIVLCSTAGEIFHTEVMDDSLSITAIQFDKTSIDTHFVNIDDAPNSYQAGKTLLEKFDTNHLRYVLVFSDGGKVNGSELVRGMNDVTNGKILVTGGLAGDGSNFQSTLVGLNAVPSQGVVAAIGFYGNALKIRHGSNAGWEMFGLEKEVTKSVGNVLFEIQQKNALELYKQYLGPEAESLPGSALLFPLAVTLPGVTEEIVRTILSIDEDAGSMTFAGDIPIGSKVRLMKANFDKLTHAASDAAIQTQDETNINPQLAILISCVGRKLILKSRTEEEVEAVNEIFDHKTMLTGFYSYGEISPLHEGKICQLHNQTMTITTFSEDE